MNRVFDGLRATGTDIVPRWEWRVFDSAPSALIASMAPAPSGEAASSEIYLLSDASPHNAKIRRGMLELKQLVRTAADGFELWKPVLSVQFPAPPDAFARLWRLLGVRPPPCPRPIYSQTPFIAEVLAATNLVVVELTKRRARFQVAGCDAEHGLITVATESWETMAIEDADLERLRAARASLTGYTLSPSSYPAWLKELTGIPIHPVTLHGELS